VGLSKSEKLTVLRGVQIAYENFGSYISVLAQGAYEHAIN